MRHRPGSWLAVDSASFGGDKCEQSKVQQMNSLKCEQSKVQQMNSLIFYL